MKARRPVAPQDEPHQPAAGLPNRFFPIRLSRRHHRRTASPETDAVCVLMEQARACRRLSLSRRINWRINWRRNCAIKIRQALGMVQGLLQGFSLSSQKALRCVSGGSAAAYSQGRSTRDALIRVQNRLMAAQRSHGVAVAVCKRRHLGLFTGRLVSAHNEANLSRSLNRIIGKAASR